MFEDHNCLKNKISMKRGKFAKINVLLFKELDSMKKQFIIFLAIKGGLIKNSNSKGVYKSNLKL